MYCFLNRIYYNMTGKTSHGLMLYYITMHYTALYFVFLKSAHIMVRSILQHTISLYYSAFYCLIKYIHIQVDTVDGSEIRITS